VTHPSGIEGGYARPTPFSGFYSAPALAADAPAVAAPPAAEAHVLADVSTSLLS
jgi:hypothetical protein